MVTVCIRSVGFAVDVVSVQLAPAKACINKLACFWLLCRRGAQRREPSRAKRGEATGASAAPTKQRKAGELAAASNGGASCTTTTTKAKPTGLMQNVTLNPKPRP